jgi:integrase
MSKLTALKVRTALPGKHGDGRGLQLVVSSTGARKWVFRIRRHGRSHEYGLGSYPSVSLADAREKAAELKRRIKAGLDPRASSHPVIPTFWQLTVEVVSSLENGFSNPKHKAQWWSTLKSYGAPLHSKRVDLITTADIIEILKPIWLVKPETASRLRGRIEKILDAAKAKGFRDGENPASWRGNLDHLLPRQRREERGHFKAMPFEEVPAFVALLLQKGTAAHLALIFTIITAARSGSVLGAKWSEIDFETKIWTIPAVRMKAKREFQIPLSSKAIEILRNLEKHRVSEFIFPGRKSGRPLSDTSMEMALKRLNITNATPHGFRASFRDWAGDKTHHAREVIEGAMAHAIGNRTEQAYRRRDALEKRRLLMEDWSEWCAPPGD